jgi:hypothetical protein
MESWRGYLSDNKIKLLDNSWSGTFRNSILFVLKVKALAENYSENEGRPTKKGARVCRLNYSEKVIRLWQRRKHETGKEFRDKYLIVQALCHECTVRSNFEIMIKKSVENRSSNCNFSKFSYI